MADNEYRPDSQHTDSQREEPQPGDGTAAEAPQATAFSGRGLRSGASAKALAVGKVFLPILASATTSFGLRASFTAAAMVVGMPGFAAVPAIAISTSVGAALVMEYLKHRQARARAEESGAPPPAFDWKKAVAKGVVLGAVGFGLGIGAGYAFDHVGHWLGGGGHISSSSHAPMSQASAPGKGHAAVAKALKTPPKPAHAPVPPSQAASPLPRPSSSSSSSGKIAMLRKEIQAHIDAGDFNGLVERGVPVKKALEIALAKNDWHHIVARLAGAGYLDFNHGGGAAIKHTGARLYGLAERVANAADPHGGGIVNSVHRSFKFLAGFTRYKGDLALG
ncbi:MAG: hypothetical protein KGI97_00455 [Alphaproteobacteria bacterium]|nr:hypothetical protein [Alphaproteobacteria bacterium]